MCFLPRLLKLKGNVRISRNWLLSVEWRITWPQFQWILLPATTASLGGLWPLESLDSMTKLWNVSTLKMCIFHHTIFCFRFRGFTNPRHDIIYTGHKWWCLHSSTSEGLGVQVREGVKLSWCFTSWNTENTLSHLIGALREKKVYSVFKELTNNLFKPDFIL